MNDDNREAIDQIREPIIKEILPEIRFILNARSEEKFGDIVKRLHKRSGEDPHGFLGYDSLNLEAIVALAETDRQAYRLISAMTAEKIVNGVELPSALKFFAFRELMKFSDLPPKKSGPKPIADNSVRRWILQTALNVAEKNNIVFFPYDAGPDDVVSACHIVAEALSRVRGEAKVAEKHRYFKASWINDLKKKPEIL